MFLKQQIQLFYLNNATNLHPRRVDAQNRDRVATTDYCDVIAPYVY